MTTGTPHNRSTGKKTTADYHGGSRRRRQQIKQKKENVAVGLSSLTKVIPFADDAAKAVGNLGKGSIAALSGIGGTIGGALLNPISKAVGAVTPGSSGNNGDSQPSSTNTLLTLGLVAGAVGVGYMALQGDDDNVISRTRQRVTPRNTSTMRTRANNRASQGSTNRAASESRRRQRSTTTR